MSGDGRMMAPAARRRRPRPRAAVSAALTETDRAA